MEHTHAEHQGGGSTREIWKVTIILTVLTIIELVLGFMMIGIPLERVGLRLLTIVGPLALFIWFIIAFLYDGNSFKNLRNTYDPHYKEQSTIKVEKKEHKQEGGQH
jgi:cytochrome c oxidase subunit 4